MGRNRPRTCEYASVRRRALAFLVDFALVGGGVLALVARSSRGPLARAAGFVVLGNVVGSLYHALGEGSVGQTVGKRYAGIAVVDEDGGAPTYRAATVRTALRFVDALPAGYLVGVASVLLTERRQRLGDLAAETVVVRTRDRDDPEGGAR